MGNRCIERDKNSIRLHDQTQSGVILKDPDMRKEVFHFPTIIDTLRAYRPTSGTGSLNSVETRSAVTEIFARERRRVPLEGNRVVAGDLQKTTTVSLSNSMDSACASKIGGAATPCFEDTRVHGHTHTHRNTFFFSFRYSFLSSGLPFSSCLQFVFDELVDERVCCKLTATL